MSDECPHPWTQSETGRAPGPRPPWRAIAARSAVALLSVLLTACGGGGGGGGGSGGGGGGGGGTPPSSDASLAALTVTHAELDQIFQPGQTEYTAGVGFLVASVRVGASSEDLAAIVRVNGTRIGAAGADVSLEEGANTIEIEVTAEDGVTTALYTLTATRQSADSFAQDAYVKASNTGAVDWFGYPVALSGDTLAVGAYLEDSAATGVGGDQSSNSLRDAGAAYVFD